MATTFPNRWFERRERKAAVPAKPAHRTDYGFVLYFMLHSLGFMSVTLLMTWGVFVLFFLAIGGFSVDGMMHHLANLSTRYIAADAARLEHFKLIVGATHMVIACAIIFFRRHALMPRGAKVLEQAA